MAKNLKFLNCGGRQMPSVGLGTAFSGHGDESELENALEAALETGYRHIDTAFSYNNEQVIGRVLKKWFSSGKLKREDIFITTKCPIEGIHVDKIETYMKKSLENLQLDYVDLYLLHFAIGGQIVDGKIEFDEEVDHTSIWKKMEEQVRAGRTKTIGLSNFSVKQIKRILKSAEIPPANLQVELHVFLQQPVLVNSCRFSNISVVAYCPLANPSFKANLEKLGYEISEKPNALNNSKVTIVAKKHDRTNAQILLRYLLQLGVGVIPKSVNPERIKENFQLFNFSLDDDDMETLKSLDMGQEGRICDGTVFGNLADHPEYPFK